MKLVVTHKYMYGEHLYYPVCRLSHAITQIKKSKCLSERDLVWLVASGIEFEIKRDESCTSEDFKERVLELVKKQKQGEKNEKSI